jgi:hypothetical protein
MLRVGALPRIARPLLRFSLHAGDDSRDALSQLQAMLPEARGRDADLIRWVRGPGKRLLLGAGSEGGGHADAVHPDEDPH